MYWTPGWDCHGLPIELKARTVAGEDALIMRKKCRQFAEEAIKTQRDTMRTWGLACDYSAYYQTMDSKYEADQLLVLAKMVKSGLVYSALRPVYWSPSSKTALAEAEVEYAEMDCTTAYVRFPVSENEYFLAWTTTPWTLFGNRGLAINPDIKYVRVPHEGVYYILSQASADHLFPNTEREIVENLPPRYFMDGRERPVLMADWVTSEVGTGVVHLAPAHGHEDYLLCKQHGIEIDDPLIDEDAKYLSGPLQGTCIFDNHKSVLAALEPSIFRTRNIKHSYPIDWRTKQPLVLRATRQWFLKTSELISQVEQEVDRVQFVPTSAKDTLLRTIKGRKSDWCISRQRLWGVPIPSFNNKVSREAVLTANVIEKFADVVREKGSDAWYDSRPRDFGLKDEEYERGGDTLDVWFDSGIAWTTVKDNDDRLVTVVEGSDQFRGWFQSLLLTWLCSNTDTKRPIPIYTTLVKHGFVLDAQGKKMSKSLGNVVDPQAACEKYGVDACRLWVASSTFAMDVTIGTEALAKCAEKVQKFRNTFRFILGNTNDAKDLDSVQLLPLDQAAVNSTKRVEEEVARMFEAYQFDQVVRVLYEFVTEELSGFYFDLIKDRLYVLQRDSSELKSAQLGLLYIGHALKRMLNPITPFLCSEAESHLLPTSLHAITTHGLELKDLQELRKELTSGLNGLAQLRLFVPKDKVGNLSARDVCELVRCADVTFIPSEHSRVSAEQVKEEKCPRCWAYRSITANDLCPECHPIVASMAANKEMIYN